LESFRKFSKFSWFYLDFREFNNPHLHLSDFDAVAVHYSVRLPFDQLNSDSVRKLSEYNGVKILFIQDEYDHTNKAKKIIGESGFNLVFTSVPTASIERIYPKNEFAGIIFVNNLTGYVPVDLCCATNTFIPPSKRSLVISYRSRSLPLRYGRLGIDKVEIGRFVKKYCRLNGISSDIAWNEEARIYGDDWYNFLCSAKSMLGSESGSNVFDWDGSLEDEIEHYKIQHQNASDEEIYQELVASRELDGLMNQVSPRIFEMIAARTVMVLFEGTYSNVIVPYKHYFPLKKDFSNIRDIFNYLKDAEAIDRMVNQAYEDIIQSQNYSYKNFIEMIEENIDNIVLCRGISNNNQKIDFFSSTVVIEREPYKAKPKWWFLPAWLPGYISEPLKGFMLYMWQRIPLKIKDYINKRRLMF
jgi:hypothetical protein